MDSSSRIKAGYESIRLSFINKTPFEKCLSFLTLPIVVYAVYLLYGILSHTILDSGIPNEYREAANVFMTMEFMEGKNPYALSSLGGELPPMIYVYGPLYSLVTAFIGSVFKTVGLNINIVSLHYGVTFFCILISALLSYIMVYKKTKRHCLAAAAFVFLINCSWRYNYVNAVPDALGLMIMMLILFLISKEEKRFTVVAAALLTALIFFTKQYYFLIAGTVTIYLFLSKGFKASVKYLVSLFLISASFVLILLSTCPLFTTYMLYLAKGPGKGVSSNVTRGSVKMTGMEYNFSQIMSLGGIFLFFFILEVIGVIYFARKFLMAKKKFVLPVNAIESFDLLMIIHLFVSGVCLLYLGQNDGAWLSYYLELFMPALIMGALSFLGIVFDSISERKSTVLSGAALSFFLILLIFTVYKSSIRLPLSPVSESDREEWKEAVKVLDENPGDMYLYPHLSYYGIENDIYVYNTGQPFVVSDRFYKSYHKHTEMMERYPYAEEIFTEHFAFRDKIRQRVLNGEYSVVSYIEDMDTVFDRDDLQSSYRKAGTFALRTGRQVWDTELWVRVDY